MGSIHLMLAALAVLGYGMAVSAATCQSDADCSGGQRCVLHSNYSNRANCETDHRCISVSSASCSCYPGFECRLKDCPSSPYEWSEVWPEPGVRIPEDRTGVHQVSLLRYRPCRVREEAAGRRVWTQQHRPGEQQQQLRVQGLRLRHFRPHSIVEAATSLKSPSHVIISNEKCRDAGTPRTSEVPLK
ncbi:uncharacterized protein LOC119373294 isoform X1 [Rhipicephalus sanguineus]|uniref:uncharacterized protein LOC119373294 isoform X1 n=1 Tax=Rhipicephalus sanguineus TaxID=34632 RepID=UPI0020C51E87|nr:uncharacterized protein LOC119373294 isoform X1 [Rhipicephalus sanguineus]